MDYTRKSKGEIENDQKGLLLSMSVHVVLLALVYFMPTGGIKPPPDKMPIVVELPTELLGGGPALGLPNQGQGDTPSPGKPDPDAGGNKPSKLEPKPDPEPVKTPPPPVKPVISKPAPAPTPPKRVETTEDPNAAIIRRQQEETRRKAEEERYRQQAAERERKRQADEAAAEKRRAEEEARAQQAARDKFKDKFKTGSGTGTSGGNSGGGGTGGGFGNSGNSGSGGRPDGDPDSRRLDGIGRGPGVVNGFGGRGVRSAPRLQENSQKQGRVVLDVCVDDEGNVVSAKYKAVGSTTTDDELVDAAVRNARQYKFAPSDVDKQCGTITYNFIVR